MVSMRYASIRTRNFWSIRCTSVWIVGSKTVFTRQTANRWPIDGTLSIWARLWIAIGRCTLFSNMFTHMTVIRTTRRPTVWPKKVHANTDNITTISKRQLDNTNRMRNRDSSEAFSPFNLYKKNQTIIFQHQKNDIQYGTCSSLYAISWLCQRNANKWRIKRNFHCLKMKLKRKTVKCLAFFFQLDFTL